MNKPETTVQTYQPTSITTTAPTFAEGGYGPLMFVPATPFADGLDARKYILIKGARVNNLKSVSVAIPRNKMVVITGLSGSGKSSLAFDTLFAEGQRMYVESLSSYARQFLGRMEKPEVDYIKGVSPAIAIEQKVNTRNPRSTVGTSTEIYDYLKLLFARIGITISPVSGLAVSKDTVQDVLDFLARMPLGTRYLILCPLLRKEDRTLEDEMRILLQNGFTRLHDGEQVLYLEEMLEGKAWAAHQKKQLFLLIDRDSTKAEDEDSIFRQSDSIQTAFYEGEGQCIIEVMGVDQHGQPTEGQNNRVAFSDKFERDGISFEEPSINLFSFNNPYGACKTCEGFGRVLGIDPDLVIPEPSLSIFEGAIAPWKTETMREEWLAPLLKNGIRFDFPIHRPYADLSDEERDLLWHGNQFFRGIYAFFDWLESQTHKIQYRVMLSRFRGRTTCPDCRGTRLRKDASYVKINTKSISDLVLMPIEDLSKFIDGMQLQPHEEQVAKRVLAEVRNRLHYLQEVGLGYLTLNRLTSTLSGGEFQRIKLATSLGSALVGSMYILDEPSIGLHPRDTKRLVGVLERLRNMGNTVIVVEHEEEVMLAADQIIDIGPNAGNLGGHLVFQMGVKRGALGAEGGQNGAHFADLGIEAPDSHTYRFLTGQDQIPVPKFRRKWANSIHLVGARENNLKGVSVKIPLLAFTVVTGVSGSGKSTLIKKVLYPALARHVGLLVEEGGKYEKISGGLSMVEQVEFVDQNPIGKSSRSNPVTYIKAYDQIRTLYADQALSKARGYAPGHFSFNVDGGRCDTCQGEGEVKIEMQFMADIYLKCEGCGGTRFKQEIQDVKINGSSISDVLNMTIDDSLIFFADKPKIMERLQPLQDVGLGYVRLGQSSNTLSGGEAQRVKLASFLGRGGDRRDKIMFIFDEPTTGLHFHDIGKLLSAMQALVDQGNTVLVIEHNPEVIKCADWVIDMGPEGGTGGGLVCYEGTPEGLAALEDNHTGRYLRGKV